MYNAGAAAAIGTALLFLFPIGLLMLVISAGWLAPVIAEFQRKGLLDAMTRYFKAWAIHWRAMLVLVLAPIAVICFLALFPLFLNWILFNNRGAIIVILIYMLSAFLLPFLLCWCGLAAYFACRDIFPNEETPLRPDAN